MVRIQHFHCQGLGSIPGWGTMIPQALQCGKGKKKLSRNPYQNTNGVFHITRTKNSKICIETIKDPE